MGTPQRAPQTTSPNPSPPSPHPNNRSLRHSILPPLRHPIDLAHPPPLPPPHPTLQSRHIRDPIPALRSSPPRLILVSIRIIFPRSPPPIPGPPRRQKIHLRLPSPRHNLPRSIYILCYRSARIQHPIPRNNQHPPNARLQLPHPTLPRLGSSTRPSIRLQRILPQHPLPRRAPEQRFRPSNNHSRRRRPRIPRRPPQHPAPCPPPPQRIRKVGNPLRRKPRPRTGIRRERVIRSSPTRPTPVHPQDAARYEASLGLHDSVVLCAGGV